MILIGFLERGRIVQTHALSMQQAIMQLLPPHKIPTQSLLMLWRKKQMTFSNLKSVNDKLLNFFF